MGLLPVSVRKLLFLLREEEKEEEINEVTRFHQSVIVIDVNMALHSWTQRRLLFI